MEDNNNKKRKRSANRTLAEKVKDAIAEQLAFNNRTINFNEKQKQDAVDILEAVQKTYADIKQFHTCAKIQQVITAINGCDKVDWSDLDEWVHIPQEGSAE